MNVRLVSMLPTPCALLTVKMPSCTTQRAGVWSCAETHWSWFLPSNRTIASEGGAPGRARRHDFGFWLPDFCVFGFGLGGLLCGEQNGSGDEGRQGEDAGSETFS